MSGHFSWWANRKSRIGMSPSALPAPHLPSGKPWWSAVPMAAPQPEHIEYAIQYMLELQRMSPTKQTHVLMAHVGTWIRAARRLLHERVESDRGELHTTDGLIIAAVHAIGAMATRIRLLGGDVDERWYEIKQALEARASEAKRRRATGGHS